MDLRFPLVWPVLITLPRIHPGEAGLIRALQDAFPGIIHLRKPEERPEALAGWLGELRDRGADMQRLTLHSEEALALRYGCGGVHLKTDRLAQPGLSGGGNPLRVSVSTHNLEEAARWGSRVDYLFLSPLFDSISKAGYRSGIDIGEAERRLGRTRGALTDIACPGKDLIPSRIVALGGISPENIARVKRAGFGGAAVLGALWAFRDGMLDQEQTLRNLDRLNRRWLSAGSGLQLISDGDRGVAEAFLRGGGRWIQLRMKGASDEAILARGRELSALCRDHGALLLLNDRPEWVRAAGAHGVHLGKSDMAPLEARRIVGDGAIIGATANMLEDIDTLDKRVVDYIGLGPYRYTITKQNLAPVLGVEGYRTIMQVLRERSDRLPVVAIGGIVPEDVPGLMDTGIDGVAVSGDIARAADPEAQTRRFLAALF